MPDDRALGSTEKLGRGAVELLRRARARAPRVVLLVYHRDGSEVVPLSSEERGVVVGRASPPADVAVEDASLSRAHARFRLDGDAVVVEDLGSTNGTWVGGERVERAGVPLGAEVALGAVTVAVHALETSERVGGLLTHDRFSGVLEEEVERARFFGRKTSLLVLKAPPGETAGVSRWSPAVQAALRPVDRAGLYAREVVEVVLPEADAEAAARIARTVVDAAGGAIVCGVATFPVAATGAETLLEVAVEAARRCDGADRVSIAPVVATIARVSAPPPGEGPVAASAAMRELFETVERVAESLIPVLLQGETGAGKEVIARAIHDGSARRDRPLIFVNCGAIPPQLVEGTLFGHEKGAFTGATHQSQGVFEAAAGGTVLLDEIGELPASAQVALLRVLETKRIVRVGSTRELAVDARVIAATHRDLEAMCESGGFRLDLLYRLNVMTLAVPPLRERPEDVAPLAHRFLAQANAANGRTVRGFDPDVLELFSEYAWPGNVRELKNAVERAVVVARDPTIAIADLPERVRAAGDRSPARLASGARPSEPPPAGKDDPRTGDDSGKGAPFRDAVQRFEIELILGALKQAAGSQTAAARLLQMPLRTFIHKMNSYGIKKLGYGG